MENTGNVSHNHCVKADSRDPLPWCYTTDPNVRWEHCDCDDSDFQIDYDQIVYDQIGYYYLRPLKFRDEIRKLNLAKVQMQTEIDANKCKLNRLEQEIVRLNAENEAKATKIKAL